MWLIIKMFNWFLAFVFPSWFHFIFNFELHRQKEIKTAVKFDPIVSQGEFVLVFAEKNFNSKDLPGDNNIVATENLKSSKTGKSLRTKNLNNWLIICVWCLWCLNRFSFIRSRWALLHLPAAPRHATVRVGSAFGEIRFGLIPREGSLARSRGHGGVRVADLGAISVIRLVMMWHASRARWTDGRRASFF